MEKKHLSLLRNVVFWRTMKFITSLSKDLERQMAHIKAVLIVLRLSSKEKVLLQKNGKNQKKRLTKLRKKIKLKNT